MAADNIGFAVSLGDATSFSWYGNVQKSARARAVRRCTARRPECQKCKIVMNSEVKLLSSCLCCGHCDVTENTLQEGLFCE